jgi:hypothetical protein
MLSSDYNQVNFYKKQSVKLPQLIFMPGEKGKMLIKIM